MFQQVLYLRCILRGGGGKPWSPCIKKHLKLFVAIVVIFLFILLLFFLAGIFSEQMHHSKNRWLALFVVIIVQN